MRRSVLALAATALALAPGAASAAPVTRGACATADPSGGDWPQHSGDLLASNAQRAEKTIGPANVADLQLAWTAPTSFQSVPAVAGRCVYITSEGKVRALDLAKGAQVFATAGELPAQQYQPFGVAVAGNRVHVAFDNNLKPEATAFDASTGKRLWTSEPVRFGYDAWQLQSAVVYGGMQLLHTTGPDFDLKARPGYGIFDAATGATLHKQTVIPPKDLDAGYAGGGVWGTPAVDPKSGYAFVGTANPDSKTREHRYDNAIIKIDLRRSRSTFGRVVDAYKGQSDNVVEGLYNQPVCKTAGANFPGPINPPCAQQDIDFGNGPTMFRTKDGELMLVEIQKSGMVHALYGDTMQRAWTLQLGTASTLTLTGGNHANAATDGKRVFVPANPGTLTALDGESGEILWTAAMAAPISSQNVIVANGVVYGLDQLGVRAWDAESGQPLWQSSGSSDAPLNCGGEAGGLAMAHHTLVANCSGTIAAFRLA